jgi:hypothetical protein
MPSHFRGIGLRQENLPSSPLLMQWTWAAGVTVEHIEFALYSAGASAAPWLHKRFLSLHPFWSGCQARRCALLNRTQEGAAIALDSIAMRESVAYRATVLTPEQGKLIGS